MICEMFELFTSHISDKPSNFELFPDPDTDSDTDPELKCTLEKTCLATCNHFNAGGAAGFSRG